jgi:hypothetical protein
MLLLLVSSGDGMLKLNPEDCMTPPGLRAAIIASMSVRIAA